jgi:excisionase family DNA binding protein
VAKTSQTEAMRARGFVSVTEAADLAHVARSTIYRWIDAEKIQAEETGLGTFVKRVSLVKHLGPEACKALGVRQ